MKKSIQKLSIRKSTVSNLTDYVSSSVKGGGSRPCMATNPYSKCYDSCDCPTGLCITFIECTQES
jgi:hypothetical protein